MRIFFVLSCYASGLSLAIETFDVKSLFLQSFVHEITTEQLNKCRTFLEDERISQTTVKVAHQILRSSVEKFTLPEDRLFIELSESSQDPILGSLTETGKKEMKRLLTQKMADNTAVVTALVGSQVQSEQQAFQILVSQSDQKIKKMIDAKDAKNWDLAIEIYEQEFSEELRELEYTRQQYAFCLNRRNTITDRDKAEMVLVKLTDEGIKDAETYGLLGRIYKDKYHEAKATLNSKNRKTALKEMETFLDKSIDIYRRGFMTLQANSYYPGINLIELLLTKGDAASLAEAKEVSITVRLMLKSSDVNGIERFWIEATYLNLTCMEENWKEARLTLKRLSAMNHAAPWMFETTFTSLMRLSQTSIYLPKKSGKYRAFRKLLNDFQKIISERTQKNSQIEIVSAPAANMSGGVLKDSSINLKEEAKKIGFGVQYEMLAKYSSGVLDPKEFLKKFKGNFQGYILGLTKAAHRPIYQGYAAASGLETWWKSYERLGISSENSNHTKVFMEKITVEKTPIVFLVPRGLFHSTIDISHTAQEMQWILDDPEQNSKNVTFVLGAYEFIPESFSNDLMSRHGDVRTVNLLETIVKGYQHYLLRQMTPE